jgi:chromosome segregation ATPase
MSTTTTRTRPRSRPKAGPSAGRKAKGGLDAKIQTMARQASAKEGSIVRARKKEEKLAAKREKARGDLLRLTAEKKTLQETLNAVKLQRKALAAEREATEEEVKGLAAEFDEVKKLVRKDKRFGVINAAVDAVDAAIKAQKDKVDDLEKALAAAQREADKATTRAEELEGLRRIKQDELRRLPDRVRERRGQLTRLVATMKAAAAAGRAWEAHALEKEFDDVAKELQGLTATKQETAIVGSVLANEKIADARGKAETATGTLATAKANLLKEQAELQKLTQERQKRIREKVEPPAK